MPNPVDPVGDMLGGLLTFVSDPIGATLDGAFTLLWQAGLALLVGGFGLVDIVSRFSVATDSGPIGQVWPLMLALAGLIALGLFFVQITLMAMRGGRGIVRVVTGPVHYGLALILGVAAIAGLLAAADGLTDAILLYTLRAGNFMQVLQTTNFVTVMGKGVSAVVLGIVAVFGVIPAALGFALEMLFRQAAILLLVATLPVVAAGLLSDATSTWFWRATRWALAAIAMKPMFALTLALGVGILSSATGGR